MAHRIASELAHMPNTRLAGDAPPEVQDSAIAEVLERAVEAGEVPVNRGPELLPVLRGAGVVDAGGYALTVIFAGIVAALRGDEPPALEHHAPARITHPHHASSTYRYCTNFAVTGELLEASRFVPELERLGDSVLVVGDSRTLKVDVHTHDPRHAMPICDGVAAVSHPDAADTQTQI